MRNIIIFLVIVFFSTMATAQTKQTNWSERNFLVKVSPMAFTKEGEIELGRTSLRLLRAAAWVDNLIIMREALSQPPTPLVNMSEGNPIMRWGIRNQPADLCIGIVALATMNYCLHAIYEISPVVAWTLEVVTTAFLVTMNLRDHNNLSSYYGIRMKLYKF